MTKYNYSVIIPSKNIPELLQRALDTIPQRDDIQVIVVDDNSDPDKVDFEHYPGIDRKNTRVLFNKDALGAGHARNVGLQYVEGKWILFMDSDDLYTNNFEMLIDSHRDDDADIVYFGITSAMSDDLSSSGRHVYKMNMLDKLSDDQGQVDFFCRFLYTEPWGKMIKRDFLIRHDIHFDETLVANDFMFSLKSGYYARKVLYDKRELYCITVREGSLSNAYFDSLPKMLSRLSVTYEAQKFFDKYGIRQYPFKYYENKILKLDKDYIDQYYNFLKEQNVTYLWRIKNTFFYSIERLYRRLMGKYIITYKKYNQ